MKAIINQTEIQLVEKPEGWTTEASQNIEIHPITTREYFIKINGETVNATLLSVNKEDKTVELLINRKKTLVQLKQPLDDLLHSMGLDSYNKKGAEDIKAPMPGLVIQILVEPGQEVKKGDKILILEAMKMENIIKANADGFITGIAVRKGMAVDKNQVLVAMK